MEISSLYVTFWPESGKLLSAEKIQFATKKQKKSLV